MLTLEAGTSFNPLNNAAFAMAGRGRSAVHLGRMVCPASSRHARLKHAVQSTVWHGSTWQGPGRVYDKHCDQADRMLQGSCGSWRCECCDGAQVAQAAGGAVGTAVALRWVPGDWQGRFRTFDQGPKPGVSLALGAACECILSFAINMVVLWSAHTRWAPGLDMCYTARACMLSVGFRRMFL